MSYEPVRREVFGEKGVSLVDRFGVWLSRRPVLRVLRRYPAPAVLDVGCGYHARLLCEIAPSIRRGVGVDFDVSDEARRHANLTFYREPVEKLLDVLAAEPFDVVLLVSVLEHLWEPLPVLRACHALLAPGGSLVINVPDWVGKRFLEFSAYRLGLSPAAGVDDHKMYYGKRDLWPLLVRAGFRPAQVRMRYHKFGLNLFAVAVKD